MDPCLAEDIAVSGPELRSTRGSLGMRGGLTTPERQLIASRLIQGADSDELTRSVSSMRMEGIQKARKVLRGATGIGLAPEEPGIH